MSVVLLDLILIGFFMYRTFMEVEVEENDDKDMSTIGYPDGTGTVAVVQQDEESNSR